MTISQVIEANLHKLDNKFVCVDKGHRIAQQIASFNDNLSKCCCEINGLEFNGNAIKPIDNPFKKHVETYQCVGSCNANSNMFVLNWRTLDNSLNIEVVP